MMNGVYRQNEGGGFSVLPAWRSQMERLIGEIGAYVGPGAELCWRSHLTAEHQPLISMRAGGRLDVAGPDGCLHLRISLVAKIGELRWMGTPDEWQISLANTVDILCLAAEILVMLDDLALASPPSHRKTWRPCRAPCGEGIFVRKADGTLVARAGWGDGIDTLCATIARLNVPTEVRYVSYGNGRMAGLDIDTEQGLIVMSLSVNPQGNPAWIEARDLPRLPLGLIGPGDELEFWIANHADGLLLTARILAELGQAGELSVGSSIGPSISARSRK